MVMATDNWNYRACHVFDLLLTSVSAHLHECIVAAAYVDGLLLQPHARAPCWLATIKQQLLLTSVSAHLHECLVESVCIDGAISNARPATGTISC
jgi:hypothetical protein